MRKLLLTLCLVIAGCNATLPLTPTKDLITITPDMVRECVELQPFVGKSEAELINYTGQIIKAYNKCDAENHVKVELLRQIFGVKVDNGEKK